MKYIFSDNNHLASRLFKGDGNWLKLRGVN